MLSEQSGMLIRFAVQLAPQLPLLAVYCVGIVIAAARNRRHPRVSRLAIIGLALLLGWSLVGTLLFAMGQGLALSAGWGAQQIGALFAGLSLLGAVVAVIAWICVLVALFSDRPAATPSATR